MPADMLRTYDRNASSHYGTNPIAGVEMLGSRVPAGTQHLSRELNIAS